jgi:tetratricopeptide (TPR) repeat protein
MYLNSLLIASGLLLGTVANAQDLAQVAPDQTVERTFREGEHAYKTIDLFTEVIERDGEHLNAYLQRGFCYSLKKNYEAAVTDFTSVVERKADHTWAYTSRGSAYNKLGKFDLAMADFDTVLGLDPKNEEAYNNRGWSKKSTGDLEGACKDWKSSKKMGNGEAAIILKNNRCK